MKTKPIFFQLTASAYAPEGENPKKLYGGELVYCREAEISQDELLELTKNIKRLIEKTVFK